MAEYKIWDIFWKSKNPKAKWTAIGVLTEKEDGSVALKLNTVPVGWDGWANCYKRKVKGEAEDEDWPFHNSDDDLRM